MELLFPSQVSAVWVVPDVSELSKVYKKLDWHKKQLEKLRATMGVPSGSLSGDWTPVMRRPYCFGLLGTPMDAQRHHLNELRKYEAEFSTLRQRLKPCPTAFIRFKSLTAASICVSSSIRFGGVKVLKIQKAPVATELLWDSLQFKTSDLLANNVIVTILVVALILTWSVPITAVQGLANLHSTCKALHWGDCTKNMSDSTKVFIEGWLSVLVLSVWLLMLPVLCKALTYMQRKTSKGRVEIFTVFLSFRFFPSFSLFK